MKQLKYDNQSGIPVQIQGLAITVEFDELGNQTGAFNAAGNRIKSLPAAELKRFAGIVGFKIVEADGESDDNGEPSIPNLRQGAALPKDK